MNNLLKTAFIIAGGTIAFDHLIHELPNWLAVILYNTSIIMFILGMYKKSREKD